MGGTFIAQLSNKEREKLINEEINKRKQDEDSKSIDYVKIANEAIENCTTIETFKAGAQIDDDGIGNNYNELQGIFPNPHQNQTSYMNDIVCDDKLRQNILK